MATSEKSPFVSVIIPVYNDPVRLAGCLEALEQQSYPSGRYEVVVVDNDSTDDIEVVVRPYEQARMLSETRRGSYAARNHGIAHARGEILAFTDSDCVPASSWIERGVENMQRNPSCKVIGGRIDFFFQIPNQPNPAEIYDSERYLKQKDYVEKENYAATANLFTWRHVFDAVGTFDASLQSGGDTEWGRRATSRGYRICYADEVRVEHPARHTYLGLRQKKTRIVGGTVRARKEIGYPAHSVVWDAVKDVGHHVKFALRMASTEKRYTGLERARLLIAFPIQGLCTAFTRLRVWFSDSGN